MSRMGFYPVQRASYSTAEPPYLRALEIHEKQLGPAHPHIKISREHLKTAQKQLQ